MDSKPMKWDILRVRLLGAARKANWRAIEKLLEDIDAAAPAMEQQERDAELWLYAVEQEGSKWAEDMEAAMIQDKE